MVGGADGQGHLPATLLVTVPLPLKAPMVGFAIQVERAVVGHVGRARNGVGDTHCSVPALMVVVPL